MTQEKALQALHSENERLGLYKDAYAQRTEQDIAELVTGMEVSIDVSTGDHDSGNRLSGVVDLVQQSQGSKHGLILLVQETKANFKEALAQEQDNTYAYASSLARAIWQKHYMKDSPKWKPLDTTDGVLTQIDNMTCGLIKEKPAAQEQEPVGRFAKFTDGIWRQVTDYSAGILLYTHPPQRTEQEPVAWKLPDKNVVFWEDTKEVDEYHGFKPTIPLYTHPQCTWVGLTEEEINEVLGSDIHAEQSGELRFIRAIEAKLKERNT